MKSEKRFFAAVALSFLILILYPFYLKWIAPQSATPPASETRAAVKTDTQTYSAPEAANVTEAPIADSTAKTYQFSNDHFSAEFSELGGTIMKLKLINWGRDNKSEVVLIEASKNAAGSFVTKIPGQGIDFENKLFALERFDVQIGEIVFISEEAAKWKLRKLFRFDPKEAAIWANVEITNLANQEQLAPLEIENSFVISSTHQDRLEAEAFVSTQGKMMSAKAGKIQKKPFLVTGEILWHSLTRQYFTLIIRPDKPAVIAKTTAGTNGNRYLKSSLQFSPEQLSPLKTLSQSFLLYAGPQYYKELKSYDSGFEQILSQGFFGIFKLWLLRSLQWAHNLTGNYGWAIILITVLLKLLFTPLTHMSFESMKKMQALQPKLKAIQEQHKNDQARLSKEMMELYKKYKVNPMSGCLPMVLQIPIFIAFYQVLAQTVELQGEPFIFWIRDLSEADRAFMLPFTIPFLGDAINILPLLMIGSMVWQQRLTPQTGTSEQQKMMMFMPIIFGFIFYSLPSGLVLYWFVNNMLSIFHQLFIKGKALPHHE